VISANRRNARVWQIARGISQSKNARARGTDIPFPSDQSALFDPVAFILRDVINNSDVISEESDCGIPDTYRHDGDFQSFFMVS